MKSVTSVSGGKTSSYMAIKYPTDFYVFACVLTNHKQSISKDKGLVREVQSRIPHFIATHEDDKTLEIILNLEQELGKEIKWVSSEFPLEDFVNGTTDLPSYRSGKHRLFNRVTRFCTVEQKIKPIAQYCHYFLSQEQEPVLMNIGFRWDEPKRVESWNCTNDKIKLAKSTPMHGGNWKYENIEWRISNFPLYQDRITNDVIRSYWDRRGWDFPEISNCRFCPFHTDVQLQRQAIDHPENLQWWLEIESMTGNTFGDRPLVDRLQQPLLDVFWEKSCSCTD